MAEETEGEPTTIYEFVGGQRFFDTLVDRFYEAVETDELLRPLYPDDLTESRRHLAGFLAQYFGGPTHYSAERGHPRLRMRHAPFVIGLSERDAWVRHMTEALYKAELPPPVVDYMLEYFDMAATAMINNERPNG